MVWTPHNQTKTHLIPKNINLLFRVTHFKIYNISPKQRLCTYKLPSKIVYCQMMYLHTLNPTDILRLFPASHELKFSQISLFILFKPTCENSTLDRKRQFTYLLTHAYLCNFFKRIKSNIQFNAYSRFLL